MNWKLWPIGFCLLAMGGCSRTSSEETADVEARGTPVAALEIRERDLSRRFSSSGTVEPRVEIRLASRVSGTLQAIFFEEGDVVEAGDLLVQMDVTEQEAELARAKAIENQARLKYQRVSRLRDRNISSSAEYEEALGARQVAESERKLWESRVAHGTIRAPQAGMVAARFVEPGEAVNAQESLLRLVALNEMVIRIGVSELDVVHLRVGQDVPVTLDALPGKELDATIRRIFPTAESQSRLVLVEVALPPEASELGVKPGFLGRARFTVDQRSDALAVPSAAIGEDGEERYVFAIHEDRLERRIIETGVSRGEWTEVVSGLESGDLILASNPIDREEGERVRVVQRRG